MTNDKRIGYVTRDRILKLLSDDEVAKVSNAESGARLLKGDEYVDLEKLDLGVQLAQGTEMPMGGVLPKSAVHEKTWAKILKQLTGPRAAANP